VNKNCGVILRFLTGKPDIVPEFKYNWITVPTSKDRYYGRCHSCVKQTRPRAILSLIYHSGSTWIRFRRRATSWETAISDTPKTWKHWTQRQWRSLSYSFHQSDQGQHEKYAWILHPTLLQTQAAQDIKQALPQKDQVRMTMMDLCKHVTAFQTIEA